jgi:DNA-binding IclR family transcriptional regulator
LASLSPKQKEIFQVIASYGNGLQVTVLAEKVGLNRSEVVYRVRELTAQGLLSSEVSEFLTDHQVRISERIIFLREDYRVEYKNALKKH